MPFVAKTVKIDRILDQKSSFDVAPSKTLTTPPILSKPNIGCQKTPTQPTTNHSP